MVTPAQAAQMVQALTGQANVAPDDLEARARQGRLTFAATITALKNNCDCEPCQLLRQAVDQLLADTKKDLAPSVGVGPRAYPSE